MSETQPSDPSLLCDCGDPGCPGRVPVRHPFSIAIDNVSDDLADAELYLTVRTSSWEFNGERTDLHDMLSVLWAAALRVREIASVRLVTVLNGFSGIDSEIYARHLVLAQEGLGAVPPSLKARAISLSDESLAMFDLLIEAFGRPGSVTPSTAPVPYQPEPDWVGPIRRRYRMKEHQDYEVRLRPWPRWAYFGSNKRGVMAAEIGDGTANALRRALGGFQPRSTAGVDTRLYRTDRLVNAPSEKAISQLRWLLQQVDGGPGESLIIPTDSHLIGVGTQSIAAVFAPGGRDRFEIARDELAARRAEEAALLNEDHVCTWADQVDAGRFERLVQDLLAIERGVHRVRQVGDTREPDDGRDLLADWVVPVDRGGIARREESGLSLSMPRQVLVQVKVRKQGVGRSDLPGLRDTLDHHGCGGLLVVAYPRVTVPLMDHLNELRRRGKWWVDWWGRTELEARLRRHPDVAARFPDLVALTPPAGR